MQFWSVCVKEMDKPALIKWSETQSGQMVVGQDDCVCVLDLVCGEKKEKMHWNKRKILMTELTSAKVWVWTVSVGQM